ncbi:MAG: hypothetical protein AABY15_02195 [Nanoarchaeota archaeon]
MKEDLDEHIDHLIELMDSVPVGGKITLLTGSNGSGKSLIRKQIAFKIGEKIGVEARKAVASTSMEKRTSSNPEWGGLSGAMMDTAWMPTSNQTLGQIEGLLKIDDKYLVIDEPEIGMGEETVMALVDFLNDKFKALGDKVPGVMIISHNRYIVEHLNYDCFLNTDGIKTKEEWLGRKLVPTDLKMLDENPLFFVIRDREKKAKEEK